jgi:hypothetical protein
MLQHRKREIGLAICSSALAGYVDAIGFLSLGGFFVSFMSGNSTRLAVGIAGFSHDAIVAGQLIGSFVIGAVIGLSASSPANSAGGLSCRRWQQALPRQRALRTLASLGSPCCSSRWQWAQRTPPSSAMARLRSG